MRRRDAILAGVLVLGDGLTALGGCEWADRYSQRYEASRVDEAIAKYREAAAKIQVGDSRDQVLALLEPTQFNLLSNETKPPVSFPIRTATGEERYVDVFFFRSARRADEQVDSTAPPPDDDFTPYIFERDVLTAVGWSAFLMLQAQQAPNPTFKPDQAPCPSVAWPLSGCF